LRNVRKVKCRSATLQFSDTCSMRFRITWFWICVLFVRVHARVSVRVCLFVRVYVCLYVFVPLCVYVIFGFGVFQSAVDENCWIRKHVMVSLFSPCQQVQTVCTLWTSSEQRASDLRQVVKTSFCSREYHYRPNSHLTETRQVVNNTGPLLREADGLIVRSRNVGFETVTSFT